MSNKPDNNIRQKLRVNC